ncbi:PQQ-dependent sugar dehydrogenase [Candidatus Curtissbacteria bacterium]|nr:PQQ-dependent sugar dehydrogenase [Candidatus Curtissbacteria bacterium]
MLKRTFLVTVIIICLATFAYFIYYKSVRQKMLQDIPVFEVPEAKDSITNTDSPKLEIVASNLEVPWALAFLPDGSILVTERSGQIKLISDGKTETVANINVKQTGESGLHGITIHLNFNENKYVYIYYTYSGSGDETLNKVERYKFENNKFVGAKTIIDGIPGAIFHDGGRIKFGPDKLLYITTGDAQNPSQAQDKKTLGGKILRLTDEGVPAPGNPFKNQVYSFGHRNPQGITWDDKGNLWETEHGPSGSWPNCCQDEVNKIEKGANFGWPDSVGDKILSGTVGPVLHSKRDIWAPAGLAYLDGSLYFGGLRGAALYEYNTREKKLAEHFKNKFGRIREVILGQDNMLYITTSNRDGRGSPEKDDDKIIKVNPALL